MSQNIFLWHTLVPNLFVSCCCCFNSGFYDVSMLGSGSQFYPLVFCVFHFHFFINYFMVLFLF